MGKLPSPSLGVHLSGGRRNHSELVNQSWAAAGAGLALPRCRARAGLCDPLPCKRHGQGHEGGWQCHVEPDVEILHFCQDDQVRGHLYDFVLGG